MVNKDSQRGFFLHRTAAYMQPLLLNARRVFLKLQYHITHEIKCLICVLMTCNNSSDTQ